MMPLSAVYQSRTIPSFHFTFSYTKVIPDAEYGNSLKEGHHFTAPIHLQTVTVTELYTYELKQVIKL